MTTAVSSVGNLALSVVIAREGTVSELGQFAVAFSMYTLVAGLAQAAVTESMLSVAPDRPTMQAHARRISAIGLVATISVSGVGLIFHLGFLVAVGVSLHGLLLADFVRIISLGQGNPWRACIQEAAWTFIVGVVVVVTLTGRLSSLVIFAIWAASGAITGYVSALSLRLSPLPRWQASRAESRTSLTFGTDYIAGTGAAQLTTTLLAGVAGNVVVGALRGAGTVLGPITLVMAASRSLLIPHLASARGTGFAARRRTAVAATMALLLLVLPLSAALMMLPAAVGAAILGPSWSEARPVLPFLALETIFSVASSVAFAGHRVERSGGRTLLIRSAMAPARIALVVGAGYAFGAVGAAVAMATVAFTGVVVWWWSYLAKLREAATPQPPPARAKPAASHRRSAQGHQQQRVAASRK